MSEKYAELLALSNAMAALPKDLVEKVARSLRVAFCSPGVPVTSWEELDDMTRGEWLEQSAATLASIGIPAATLSALLLGEMVAVKVQDIRDLQEIVTDTPASPEAALDQAFEWCDTQLLAATKDAPQ